MSDERDFAIDAEDLQAAGAEYAAKSPADAGSGAAPTPPLAASSDPASPAAPPMVVIQYRNRGLHTALLPPLLILLVALVILSYQRQALVRPLPSGAAARPAAPAGGAGRLIMVDASPTGAAFDPITVRSETPPPALPVPAAEAPPVPAAEASPPGEGAQALVRVESPLVPGPFAPDDRGNGPDQGLAATPDEPVRAIAGAPRLEPPAPPNSPRGGPLSPDSPELAFRVVAEAAPAGPAPEPKVTKEQIFQGIQEEAAQKQAEQKNLEREVVQSKAREFWETIRKVQEERPLFHDDLRRLLQELGNGAGDEIRALCDRYGREAHPEVKKTVAVALNRTAARVKREVKVALLRSHGVPEAAILDVLAHEMDSRINTRGGPRDRNEVRVLAAKLLLMYPPPARPLPPPPTATSTAPTTRNPAPAQAPRAVAGVRPSSVPKAVRPPQ